MPKPEVARCEECHQPMPTPSGVPLQVCLSCLGWRSLASLIYQWNSVRCCGRYYLIRDDASPGVRGFRGQAFDIEYFDGHIIRTANLWSIGEIPKHFRDRIPDNAIIRPVILKLCIPRQAKEKEAHG